MEAQPNPTVSPRKLFLKRCVVIIFFFPIFIALQLSHWLGFVLDELLFRKYRDIVVKSPLFIIGIPRSGTTFLHRLLAKDVDNFTTFELWELLFAPSITERWLWLTIVKIDKLFGAPIAKIIDIFTACLSQKYDDIHALSLRAPEEDYLTLTSIFSCFILVLAFPNSSRLWNLAYFDEKVSQLKQQRIMKFYRSCLQRHLFFHGADRRLLSKNPGFCSFTTAIKKEFPDCAVICTVRDPRSAVPSLLSSMQAGSESFGTPLDAMFRDRLVRMLMFFCEHLIETLPQWPKSDYVFVQQCSLKSDLLETVQRLFAHLELTLSPAMESLVRQESARSQSFKSGHRHSLEQFGISPDQVTREFSPFMQFFGYKSDGI